MNKLFKTIVGAALGLAMAVGVGVAVGSNDKEASRVEAAAGDSPIVLDAESMSLSSTATSSSGDEKTYGGVKYIIASAKSQAVQSGAANYFSSNATMLIGKSGAFVYNYDAIPGNITKIEIYANKGASAKVSIGVSTHASSRISSAPSTWGYTATMSTLDSVYDASAAIVSGARYFRYQVTNANNSQVQIRITYSSTVYATNVAIAKHADSDTPAISSKTIEIEKGAGSGSLYEKLTATATGANSATPTDATVTWSKAGTNVSYIDEWNAGDNSVEFLIDTNNEGVFTVTADADGAETAHSVTDTITYRIIDPDAAVLDHVSYTGTPVSPQYAGNAFNATGLTFKAVYDDNSEVAITSGDIDWDTLVVGNQATGTYTDEAGTTVDVTVSLTVSANTLTITIGGSMTKTSYAQNEAWDPTGLTKSGQYADGTSYSGTITWSYSPATPAELTVGENKSVTVTATAESNEYATRVVTVTITAPNYAQTNGIGAGGSFYILNDDSSYGISALNDDATSAVPGIDQSVANNTLIPFTLTLVGDYTYEITSIVSGNVCYLVNNSTAASSNNNNLRLIQKSEAANTVTQYGWEITELSADSGNYQARQNTTGTTWRYITEYITNHDFRGYTKAYVGDDITATQDSVLHFVREGAYADAIADAIMSNEEGKTLCNNGVNAPSTTLWNNIAGITKIEHELAMLRGTEATPKAQDGSASTGTTRQNAMARYDEIMVRYNTTSVTTYADFLGRIEAQNLVLKASASNSIFGFNFEAQSTSTAVIVIVSLVGLTAVGGFFFLRKRKEF